MSECASAPIGGANGYSDDGPGRRSASPGCETARQLATATHPRRQARGTLRRTTRSAAVRGLTRPLTSGIVLAEQRPATDQSAQTAGVGDVLDMLRERVAYRRGLLP